jgi:hypothetical protein
MQSNSEEGFQVDVLLTSKDIIMASFFMQKMVYLGLPLVGLGILVPCLLLGPLMPPSWQLKMTPLPWDSLLWGYIFAALFIACPVISVLACTRQAKTLGTYTVTLDEQHITTKGTTFRSEIAWSAIYKIVQLPNMLLICPSKITAITVPHRCFKSNAELVAFQQRATSLWKQAHTPQRSN